MSKKNKPNYCNNLKLLLPDDQVLSGLFTLATILIAPAVFHAQQQFSPHPSFRHYSTDDGLASSEVYHLLQDHKGYIWISTDNGVSRFDGYEFSNYDIQDGLKENVIFRMQLDNRGRIWMQAMSGNLYYTEGDTILPYWNNDEITRLGVIYKPEFIVEGAGERIFLATTSKGIVSISEDGKTKIISHGEYSLWHVLQRKNFVIVGDFANSLDFNKITTAFQPRPMAGIVHLENELGNDHFKLPQSTDPGFNYVVQSLFASPGKLLLKIRNEIFFFNNNSLIWNRSFPFHIIHTFQSKKGKIFIGLHHNQGLRVYESWDTLEKNIGNSWLQGEIVSYILADKNGGMWFATNRNGIYYAPSESYSVFDKQSGLTSEIFTSITLKNNKEIYTGQSEGTIWLLNPSSTTWIKMPELPGNDFVKSLLIESQTGELWGSRNYLHTMTNNSWLLFSKDPPGPFAYRITESPDKTRIWIAHHSGFVKINNKEKKEGFYKNMNTFRTQIAKEDFSGRVWLGTPKGLFEWKNDSIVDRTTIHPAFSLRIEDIVQLPDSTLVFATKGSGIVFWKGNKFAQFTTTQGLTADMMECLHVDNSGTVWAGTLNGLNHLYGTWNKWQVRQITTAHGMPSNEINRISSSGNDIWVATSKGLVHFSTPLFDNDAPEPFIVSFAANSKAYDVQKPIVLNHKENDLSVGFSCINFKLNGKILYRYRMDMGEWVETNDRSIHFIEISPGKRILELQARNEDMVWSKPKVLHFTIRPPWWTTWWARLSIITLAIGFVPLIMFLRMRKIKTDHAMQKRMTDLKHAAFMAQMSPHFIFNCLNSIQYFILQNDKEKASEYLGDFAKLIRIVLNASEAGEINLDTEVNLLNSYLKLEQMRFSNKFSYEIIVDEDVDIDGTVIPPLLVQPYVENAVLHGIADLDRDGKVKVIFEDKDSYIKVSILDNGDGIKSDTERSKSLSSHRSFGMSITRNRLELLSKENESDIVKTTNLFDKEGNITGTLVEIRIRKK
jgi:ligand-binding sensor domain-containing protein